MFKKKKKTCAGEMVGRSFLDKDEGQVQSLFFEHPSPSMSQALDWVFGPCWGQASAIVIQCDSSAGRKPEQASRLGKAQKGWSLSGPQSLSRILPQVSRRS